MKKIRLRYAVEVMVVVVVMLVIVTSYMGREISVVGKSPEQILTLAMKWNDYPLAQKIYEQVKVHGAIEDGENIELLIYPQKKIEAEIGRLEKLLEQYPTYPPLLSQLVKLNRINGNEDKAVEYERELQRLKADQLISF